ncbi:MAG TPA: hypothetical protein VGH72_33950 [Pseudonocardia sp.]|jgi:hypothetical protein
MSVPYSYEDAKPTTGIDLATVANALLSDTVAFFAQNGIQLPKRQYVGAGSPADIAWDCEQLVVALASVGWGRSVDATQLSPSFGKVASVNAMRHAEISIALVRKTPVISGRGVVPTPDELNKAGQQFLLDAGTLSQAMVNFVSFENPAIPDGCNVQAGSVQPFGPEGGYVSMSGGLILTVASLLPDPMPTIPPMPSGHP